MCLLGLLCVALVAVACIASNSSTTATTTSTTIAAWRRRVAERGNSSLALEMKSMPPSKRKRAACVVGTLVDKFGEVMRANYESEKVKEFRVATLQAWEKKLQGSLGTITMIDGLDTSAETSELEHKCKLYINRCVALLTISGLMNTEAGQTCVVSHLRGAARELLICYQTGKGAGGLPPAILLAYIRGATPETMAQELHALEWVSLLFSTSAHQH